MIPGSNPNSPHPPSTAGIILAAGMSSRFGHPKQLAQWNGKSLLQRVVEESMASRLDEIILVLGYRAAMIRRHLDPLLDSPQIRWVDNPRFQLGQSESVKAGLRFTRNRTDAVMFLMADQPLVTCRLIDRLLDTFRQSERAICVPAYRGQRATPVIIGRKFYPELFQITGDKGARGIIDANPDQVEVLEINNPDCLKDIDTVADMNRLLNSAHRIRVI